MCSPRDSLMPLQLGSTAVGICATDGVILAVEKRTTSPLMEPSSIEKIVEIDRHIGVSPKISDEKVIIVRAGCAVSGLTPDARTMIERARVEALVRASEALCA